MEQSERYFHRDAYHAVSAFVDLLIVVYKNTKIFKLMNMDDILVD